MIRPSPCGGSPGRGGTRPPVRDNNSLDLAGVDEESRDETDNRGGDGCFRDAGRERGPGGLRAAIVRALAMRPRLMLLDEVTSALDPELVADVLDVIRELAEGGMTMLIATHEMGFARDIASRVCFLADGQIVEQAPPGRLFSEPSDERTRRFLRRIVDAGRL
jgi:ABC-type thiamine transport system ATPase subunit